VRYAQRRQQQERIACMRRIKRAKCLDLVQMRFRNARFADPNFKLSSLEVLPNLPCAIEDLAILKRRDRTVCEPGIY